MTKANWSRTIPQLFKVQRFTSTENHCGNYYRTQWKTRQCAITRKHSAIQVTTDVWR